MSSEEPPGRKPLPAWLHFNSHDLKTLFRCAAAAWVATILMFIHPTLRTIGTATFFGCLVLFINPPSGILFIFILGTLTLLIGMALAWAWGVITMKAALAARPQSETLARLQMLGQEAARQANATGQSAASLQSQLVYDGFMLDARVSVIYFVMTCVFIYFLARLRASNPKFTLVQIFGTIIADLFLTIGPLLPSFRGTLPKLLIIPAAIGAGLGLVASLLLFPQSTSHAVLAGMQALVELAKQPLRLTAAPTDDLDLKTLMALKTQLIAGYKAMEPAMGFLPLDFSRGRWNAADVKSLRQPVRQVLVSTVSLLDYHINRLSARANVDRVRAMSKPATPVSTSDGPRQEAKEEVGQRQILESLEMIEAMTSPESEALRSGTHAILRESSGEILPVCEEAAGMAVECIHAVNSRRWLGSRAADRLDECQKLLERLRAARDAFAEQTTEKLIAQHGEIFDETGSLKRLDTVGGTSISSVMAGLAFEELVISVADALDQFLAQIVALLEARPKPRLWFPTSIEYAVRWVLRRDARTPVTGQSSDPEPDDPAVQTDETEQLFRRISRGYRVKQRSGLGRVVLGTYHWFISAEGLFALRMVILTIALAVPAVIPSSSGFYYREKGLWGLIMGQTTLLVYMSDFTFSLICRAVGTVIGGVVGLAAWYIGSGHGPGNPYGLAAISAPIIVIFMWGRLFLSPAMLQATIMSAATFFLIIGYSFADTQIPQYGNPGVGYNVFWRRLVLVFVGFAAALIVQIFPRPPSAARHICTSLSNTLRRLTDHYALLLSCWARPNNDPRMAELLSIEVAERLAALNGPIALLGLEFSSSRFDSASLRQVQALCQTLNQNLGRLLLLSATLPLELQERLARTSGVLEQRSIADVMAVLGVVAQAIKTGDPLPEVLPTPLTKRCYEFWRGAQLTEVMPLQTELIREKAYRRYCVGVMAYLRMLAAVDELVMVVKGVLGEAHIVQLPQPQP
ncbi:hypothetical protein CNMCM8927_004192 [Aspergillus lentulus]|uniref:ER transporter 6TM N-terminal domain-containing protein n=1 Tax=Aspergillus lentulus TaxID=293939 RepID=A0AAN6BRG3_ASPLE|nr:hypothetical protein CNMCM6069_007639 [Aspergillus lentulus]KAF4174717.1 hypothetical protein CNMCM8060_008368 [Aspergillus lentulus]KAF4184197.1 hypothetical protein CNMCM7927_008287 [Aspergillus lentulus]KAF4194186.1 hypothetical protein CNMCM8694_007865 [Aspergillus lentulus]KAF4206857.1 hypothetical protein CNMCM8927_004192 [Aspergillus lentulus]